MSSGNPLVVHSIVRPSEDCDDAGGGRDRDRRAGGSGDGDGIVGAAREDAA